MESELATFFHSSFESAFNEAVLDRDYVLDRKRVIEYLWRIAGIPCSEFVDHAINKMARDGITTNDIPQFSDWDDGTDVVCRKIFEAGDLGYSHYEIGRMLRGEGVSFAEFRTKKFLTACRKYGEGHAKLARSLGLLQECEKVYFLSCIGHCWNEVSNDLKERLYTRMILRTRFVRHLLQEASSGSVSVRDTALSLGLSSWSVYRRHSNVVCLLKRLRASREFDFSELINRIDVDSMLERL